ncbi:hypothetical protein [Devosia sp. 1635]|uniref:hypothetical protein n=1 Tax=Devosia sp. 1635 TaxID=2726066 RepID=UPI001565A6B4|nr:hypothetical protein [Devosia sp. 1635]
MRKVIVTVGAVVLLVPLIAYFAGVRVFVIQPIGALPDGVTAVVHGLPGLRAIDSPDAICQRNQGGVNLLCRGITAGTVARDGTILMRLPYMPFLKTLSGAPDLDE